MTGIQTRFATIAATLLIAMPLSLSAASAETVKAGSKQIVALDTTPTGSIQRADSGRNCNPNSPNAGAICKITGGKTNTKFPSAPISQFGF
ncbi:MAG: hypothetical protein AAGF25_14455 [Pseudomonadota bacterium]